MDSKLKKDICDFIARQHLKPGDRLPSIEQIRRKIGATQYRIYQALKEIAAERKYEVVHGSGFYLPGRKKVYKPFEYSIALVSPGALLEQELINSLHSRFMKHRLNLLPLSIPHHDPSYEEETLKYLLSRRIWGLIIEPHPNSLENLRIISRMQAQGCRCILLSRAPELKKKYHFFTLDYYSLGLRAAEFAKENRFRKIVFINHSSVNWHMQNLERGITERSKELSIGCHVIRDPLRQDKFSETWEWETYGIIPLLKNTLYVVENVDNRASHLYNCLIREHLNSSQVLHFCRRKSDIDPRIPCFYMNDENRFHQIADKLLGAGIWTKTGTEITFRPEQILPETETQK